MVPGCFHGHKSQGSLGHLVDSMHGIQGQRVPRGEMRAGALAGPVLGWGTPPGLYCQP